MPATADRVSCEPNDVKERMKVMAALYDTIQVGVCAYDVIVQIIQEHWEALSTCMA